VEIRIRFFALFATLAGLSACIILPIPTPEWGEAPISEEQIEALSSGAGRLTGEEIAAELGHPQRHYANDRVLVYEWTRSQGLWIVGVATEGGVMAGESEHRLCLLFSDQGVLKEVRHIDSAIFQSDAKVRSLLDDWLGLIAGESENYGLANYIDVDRYSVSLPPELHNTVGLVALGRQFWSPCEPELSALAGRGFSCTRRCRVARPGLSVARAMVV